MTPRTAKDKAQSLAKAQPQAKEGQPDTLPYESIALSSAEASRLQMVDIARMAGVSVSTVSRALNGSELVNEATRKKVQELAQSMNYSINIGAKNLRLKQNKTVGIVIPYDAQNKQPISDPFFLRMVGSLTNALTDRGYDCLLSRVDADSLDSAATLVDSGRANGIILIGQWRHHDQLNALAQRQVPFVVWGAKMKDQLYATVGSDNKLGGRLATEHLIAQGHKHIAFLGDPLLAEVAARFEGYGEALEAAKIRFDEALTVGAPFTEDGGRLAVAQLLKSKVKFDAIFACSDLLAINAINALRSEGIHVPHDVSVVGYDDIELARYFHPPITTIRQPLDLAGIALVDLLLARLAGQPSASVLPTDLVVRESSRTAS
jgi:DNA-binding LacI/PurR family transcriptional regulator